MLSGLSDECVLYKKMLGVMSELGLDLSLAVQSSQDKQAIQRLSTSK